MSTLPYTETGRLTTDLILAVFRLNGRLLAAGDRLGSDLGLTSARWQVLGALESGPGSAAEIARRMGLKRQSVQRLVDAMTADGLLKLADNPHHKRARLVHVTELGRARYAAIMARHLDWANALGEGLDPRTLASAAALAEELTRRLLEPGGPEPLTGEGGD
jgi:DNA-binding MarR family transcriptional regulator